MSNRAALTTFVSLLISIPLVARGGWPVDGLPICDVIPAQYQPVSVSDGAGGAIIAWGDYRNGSGNSDVYAQRVDGAGNVLWVDDGVVVCDAAGQQSSFTILSDDAGGAIIAWIDYRNGNYDVYAQRIDAVGVVQWTPNGVAVSTAAGQKDGLTMTSDGSSGAILAWEDNRNSATTNTDIFAARLTATGAVLDPAGIAVSVASGMQTQPSIAPFQSGGAIVVWADRRSGLPHIYAARVSAVGTVADPTGIVISDVFVHDGPVAVSDGIGALIAWRDARTPSGVYAQRLGADGLSQWTDDGVQVSGTMNPSVPIRMGGDGAGGAIIVWAAYGGPDLDIYAQRINSSGMRQWTPDDVVVCSAANEQSEIETASGNGGSVVIGWRDHRDGTQDDIYAQRVDASGMTQWTPDGVLVCGAVNDQLALGLVSDGSGGGVFAWQDHRLHPNGTLADIYARRVLSNGQLPTSVGDAPSAAITVLPAYPNPFASSTDLDLWLREPADVAIDVYDVAGRRVRAMLLDDVPKGWRRVAIDARDDSGRPLSSGVYFARVEAQGTIATRKLVLLK